MVAIMHFRLPSATFHQPFIPEWWFFLAAKPQSSNTSPLAISSTFPERLLFTFLLVGNHGTLGVVLGTLTLGHLVCVSFPSLSQQAEGG